MPLYNKAPYVGKAVESVLAQTWGEWELVVVDDGSKDGSGDIVLKYNDPRIRLHRQENAGVSVARNTGVAMATAPYVCFLDADDWWESTFLAEMSGLIDRHPDAGIYGTAYYMAKNSQQRPAPIGFDEGFTEGEINYCQVYSRTLCMPLWTGAVCMPKTVFEAEGGFKPGLRLGEDFVLWVHTALKHKVVMPPAGAPHAVARGRPGTLRAVEPRLQVDDRQPAHLQHAILHHRPPLPQAGARDAEKSGLEPPAQTDATPVPNASMADYGEVPPDDPRVENQTANSTHPLGEQ